MTPWTARTFVFAFSRTLPMKRRSPRAVTWATGVQVLPWRASMVTGPAAGARPQSCARPFLR